MLSTSQYGSPSCSTSTTPESVVPALESVASRMLSFARYRYCRRMPAVASRLPVLNCGSSARVRTQMPLATSPASWPPMPSATAKTGSVAMKASSFASRRSPRSVPYPQRSSGPRFPSDGGMGASGDGFMAVLNTVVRGFTGARGLTAFATRPDRNCRSDYCICAAQLRSPPRPTAGLIRRSVQDQAPAAAGLQLHRVDFTEPADVLGRPGHQDEAFVLLQRGRGHRIHQYGSRVRESRQAGGEVDGGF